MLSNNKLISLLLASTLFISSNVSLVLSCEHCPQSAVTTDATVANEADKSSVTSSPTSTVDQDSEESQKVLSAENDLISSTWSYCTPVAICAHNFCDSSKFCFHRADVNGVRQNAHCCDLSGINKTIGVIDVTDSEGKQTTTAPATSTATSTDSSASDSTAAASSTPSTAVVTPVVVAPSDASSSAKTQSADSDNEYDLLPIQHQYIDHSSYDDDINDLASYNSVDAGLDDYDLYDMDDSSLSDSEYDETFDDADAAFVNSAQSGKSSNAKTSISTTSGLKICPKTGKIGCICKKTLPPAATNQQKQPQKKK